MKYSEEEKYKALSLLNDGKEPRNVATELKIPVTTIIRWNKELKEEIANGGISKIIDLDQVLIGEVLTKIVDEEPILTDAANELTASLSSLERLSEELHTTAMVINSRTKSMVHRAETAAELIMLAEVVCEIQKSFFNTNSTNINIQNNNGGESRYNAFLGDKPIDA